MRKKYDEDETYRRLVEDDTTFLTRKALNENLRNIISPFPGISGNGIQSSNNILEDTGGYIEIIEGETKGKKRLKSVGPDGKVGITEDFDPILEDKFWKHAEEIADREEAIGHKKIDNAYKRLQREVDNGALPDVASKEFKKLQEQYAKTAQRRFIEEVHRERKRLNLPRLPIDYP